MSDQPTPTEDEKWVYEQVRDEARRAHDRFAEFHLAHGYGAAGVPC
jgi:hypothetical protein